MAPKTNGGESCHKAPNLSSISVSVSVSVSVSMSVSVSISKYTCRGA